MDFKFKIEKIENGEALLTYESESLIRLPSNFLPPGSKQGDWLCLSIKSLEENEAEKAKSAKDILNELLKNVKIS